MIEHTGKELLAIEDRLLHYDGVDRMVSSKELWDELVKWAPKVPAQKSGFPSMDRILCGVEAGELVVVTGPSGEGKTTLLMSITRNMADAGTQSAWFTLEVTPWQFLKKICEGNPEHMPHFYLPAKNGENTVQWLEQRIVEAKVKYDAKVIFIDHLHSIFSLARMGPRANLSLEIGDVAQKIKDIAIRENLTIFMIAHMTDDKENPTREPRKEDIRDSGMILRIADTVMAVWRVNNEDDGSKNRKPQFLREDDTRAKIRIMKNRREGRLGQFLADWSNHRLKEIEMENTGL